MGAIHTLELTLDKLLVKKAPYHLPEEFKNWAGQYVWIFAIISMSLGMLGLFGLLVTLGFFTFSQGAVGAPDALTLAWMSSISLGVQVCIIGMAVRPLKQKQKKGWNLIFYSQLVSIATSILSSLQPDNIPFSGVRFLGSMAWTAIGLYFLFQIRSQFMGKA